MSDDTKRGEIGERAKRLHAFYRGKVQMAPKCPVERFGDFSVWYTPGVAAPCRAIHAEPERVFDYTNRGNTVAIVSDGTRVLGLGDIGPAAGLPVMEGKALLFKYLGGVDAVPLCLGTKSEEELVRTVEVLQPTLGGVNLEDIESPKCFRVLDALRSSLDIPVWHDDQQGTATVLVAGLMTALDVVGKRLDSVRIAMVGAGAANIAAYRLLLASGVDPRAIVACDSKGILHRDREDIAKRADVLAEKHRICRESNGDDLRGGIAEALRGADACVAFSTPGPGVIDPAWVRAMNDDAIVFACANPVPEIWPTDAREAGARIVATGRGDFPNQLNNSLAFPGVFRGALDVRARTITDQMALAAARAIVAQAEKRGLSEERIVPRMDEPELAPAVAVATGMAAQEAGLARLPRSADELHRSATEVIERAREGLALWTREGVLPSPS